MLNFKKNGGVPSTEIKNGIGGDFYKRNRQRQMEMECRKQR